MAPNAGLAADSSEVAKSSVLVPQTQPAATGVSLSPALASYLTGKPHKGYNNPAVNTYFADSFKVQSCRVCYATITVNVQHYGDIWLNDSLTVGNAPFGSANVLLSGLIWPPNNNPKTFTWAVPTGLLNTYLMSGSQPPNTVDLFVQDDTNVHSATLSVWYY